MDDAVSGPRPDSTFHSESLMSNPAALQNRGLLMESNPQQPQQLEVPQDQLDVLQAAVQATDKVCAGTGLDANSQLGAIVFDNILRLHRSFKMERVQNEFQKKMQEVRGPQPGMMGGQAAPGPFGYDRL